MQQKDFILREIEKIGALISYLLGKYKPTKNIEEQQETEELINKKLLEDYGNDLNSILNIDESDYNTEFSQQKGFNFENIELLADLLFTIGNNTRLLNKTYLLKALSLYTYIDKVSKTFSFERVDKINTLKSLVNQKDLE